MSLHEVAGVWGFMFVERCLLALEAKSACVACTSCTHSGVLLPTEASATDTVDTFLSAEETPAFFRADPPTPPPPTRTFIVRRQPDDCCQQQKKKDNIESKN